MIPASCNSGDGGVTSVGATAPVTSTGGATPTIGVGAATTDAAGVVELATTAETAAMTATDRAVTPADLLGVGLPFAATSAALGNAGGAVSVSPSGNEARYFLSVGSGSHSAIGLHVGTAVGNISVAAYTGAGAGRAATPTGGQLATSGAVACPASGYAEVSLGSTVTVRAGHDWLAVSAASASATIYVAAGGSALTASNLGLGLQFSAASAHPLPTTPSSLTARSAPLLMLVGES